MLFRRLIGISLFFCFFFTLMARAEVIDHEDLTWPRSIVSEDSELTLYQPQVDTFKRNIMTFHMAVSVKLKDAEDVIYGALEGQCTVDIFKKDRLAYCKDFKINTVSFPSKADKQDELREFVNNRVSEKTLKMSYDRLEASLRLAQVDQVPHNTNYLFTPPQINVVNEPTALISIDGKPVLRKVKDTSLMRVINTPFVILFDSKTGDYFLRAGTRWHSSRSLTDQWALAKDVPEDVKKIEKQFKDESDQGNDINNFIVTTVPSALIEIRGEPEFSPIAGTDLMYIKNSHSKVFMQSKTQKYFVLISGRWYTSDELLTGANWTYVPGKALPASFAKIPSDSEVGDVLASVPGTIEAQEAMVQNATPTTATIKKDAVKFDVQYDGEPQFVNIEGTSLAYAINANLPVIKFRDQYYGNSQAVWFVAQSPNGPWVVAESVPDEIYTIPPQNPLYNVTYNYVYSADKDSVQVGYTPGYEGSYTTDEGTVVYGTGYDYDMWIGDDYYDYGTPQSYGYEYEYDPYYGWYSSAPYLWVGVGTTLGWWAGQAIWHHHHHHHDRDRWRDVYDRWDKDAIKDRHGRSSRPGRLSRPDYRPGIDHRERPSTRPGEGPDLGGRPRPDEPPSLGDRPRPGERPSLGDRQRPGKAPGQPGLIPSQPQLPQQPLIGQPGVGDLARPEQRPNDVYVGTQGGVYRHQAPNNWQRQSKKGWQHEGKPATTQNLNRQREARNRGNQLTRQNMNRPHPGTHPASRPMYHRPATIPSSRPATIPSSRPATRPSSRPPSRPSHARPSHGGQRGAAHRGGGSHRGGGGRGGRR